MYAFSDNDILYDIDLFAQKIDTIVTERFCIHAWKSCIHTVFGLFFSGDRANPRPSFHAFHRGTIER